MVKAIRHLHPPLAGGGALSDLPRLVPVRHRHDVLAVPRRDACRSARARARAGPGDDPALACGSARQARRSAAADAGPPEHLRRPPRLSLPRRARRVDRLRRHRRRADRRVARDGAARRLGVDRPAGNGGTGRARGRSRSVDGAGRRCAISGRCGSTPGQTASRSTSPRPQARWCSTRRRPRGSARISVRFRIGCTSRRCASISRSGARLVIWSSGIGTVAAILGLVIGVWVYSPSKRYRYAGAPTSIPYRGQKRWHTDVRPDLRTGRGHLGVQRHALDGSVSRPDRAARRRGATRRRHSASPSRAARRSRRLPASTRAKRWRSSPVWHVKELEFAAFAGEPVYLATLAGGDTRIVPVSGEPRSEFDREQDRRDCHQGRRPRTAAAAGGDTAARAVRHVLPGSAPATSAAGAFWSS